MYYLPSPLLVTEPAALIPKAPFSSLVIVSGPGIKSSLPSFVHLHNITLNGYSFIVLMGNNAGSTPLFLEKAVVLASLRICASTL